MQDTSQNTVQPDLNSCTASIEYLAETIKEKICRILTSGHKKKMEFVLVARDSRHLIKALEVAGRETKRPRNRLKKKPPAKK